MPEYRKVAISDVAEVRSGVGFPMIHQGLEMGDFAFAKVSDISKSVRERGGKIGEAENYVNQEFLKKLRITPFPAGAIVFAKIGEAIRLNFRAITTRPMLFDNNVMGLIPNTSRIDNRFLFHFMRTINLSLYANVTSVPSLRKNDIEAINIPLPLLPEQHRIAAILDKTDSLREKRRQAIAKLDELLKSVFIEMFEGPQSKEWPQLAIEDLAADKPNAIRTGPFGSQLLHSEFVDEGIAVLGIDNAVQNSFAWAGRRFITKEKYEVLKRYRVFPGDVIITIMGTCGRCAIVPDDIPLAINTKHLCCITLDPKRCLPTYLQACFLNHTKVLRQLGLSERGAVMPGLNMQIIKELVVPLPSLPLQEKFAAFVRCFDQLQKQQRKAERQAEYLFQSLQQRAFSGELFTEKTVSTPLLTEVALHA